MALRFLLAMAVLALAATTVQASDPELTTDFFIPEGVNKSSITGDYFTSTILRNGSNVVPPAMFNAVRITSDSAPVLTGLGLSAALFRYQPGGINPPHTHPRGTEILYVLEGTLTYCGTGGHHQLTSTTLRCWKWATSLCFRKAWCTTRSTLGTKTCWRSAFNFFSSSNPARDDFVAGQFVRERDPCLTLCLSRRSRWITMSWTNCSRLST